MAACTFFIFKYFYWPKLVNDCYKPNFVVYDTLTYTILSSKLPKYTRSHWDGYVTDTICNHANYEKEIKGNTKMSNTS